MIRKYSEDQMTRAIMLILNEGLTPKEVSKKTGINLRAIQRYKVKYVNNPDEDSIKRSDYPTVFKSTMPVMDPELQGKLNQTLLDRAKFLDDVFEAKKTVLDQIVKVAKKSENLDALQRTVKTLADLEKEVTPEGDEPPVHAKTVNMFQFINNQLTTHGYKGPELTDADIVKGD
jgi:hypothetical protein